ncbi:MAG: ABC transporter permease, partial [Pseudomonadota bacterium]
MLRLAPFLAVFVLAGPVIAGLAGTLGPAMGYMPALGFHGLDAEPLRMLLATPGLHVMCLLSVTTGLAATAIALLITTLFTAGWQGTRAFAALRRVLSPLLAVPHAAAAFGLAFLIAPSGWVSRLISPDLSGWERPPDALIVNDGLGMTLLAGLVVKEVPFLFLVTLAALGQADATRGRRLAASLGYGRVRGWLLSVFPSVYRQIRLPVLATLAFSASVVDMAIVLGPTTPPTLAVRIVEWTSDPDLAM